MGIETIWMVEQGIVRDSRISMLKSYQFFLINIASLREQLCAMFKAATIIYTSPWIRVFKNCSSNPDTFL